MRGFVRFIYLIARLSNDLAAVKNGKIGRRLWNKVWGRLTSKGYRRK
jgi:hypothetical protein